MLASRPLAAAQRLLPMSRLFFRIYGALILALLGIGSLAYFGVSLIEARREALYQHNSWSAPMRLIADGISRHQAEQGQKWIDIATRLFNAEILVLPSSGLDAPNRDVLARGKVLVERRGGQHYLARIAFPGDATRFVQLNVSQWNEQQWRATLFLLLNEIGRHPVAKENGVLQRLSAELEFPLYRTRLEASGLDPRQTQRIRRGEVVMQVLWSSSERASTQFVAPYGRVGEVLVMGPVPVFVAYPARVLLPTVGLGMIAFTMVALSVIRWLERRLARIENAVAQIGPEALSLDSELLGARADAVGRLARTISSMIHRLHGLLAAQREMVQGITHDLRTPVSRIRLRLALLKPEQAAQQDKASGILRDLDEIERLIDEAITWSQLQHTPANLIRERFDLSAEIAQIVGDLQISGNRVSIQTTLPAQACWVTAHRGHLHRLLQNLLDNAMRYAQSQVRLDVSDAAQEHVLMVEDDGPGIPIDLRALVFEPFARVDGSRSKESGGYGLGLAIVRRIAELHGGHARCVSSELGGAAFRVSWPKQPRQT